MIKFDCEDCFDTGFVPDSFPLQPCHCISDEGIKKWVDKVAPERGGYKSDYIFAAKYMRDKLLKMIK
jgi:hypothetical protein